MDKSPFVPIFAITVSSTVAVSVPVAIVSAAIVVGGTIVAVVAAVMGVVVMLVVMSVVNLNLLLLVSGLWNLDDINGWDFDDLGHFFLNYALVGR